MKKYTLEIKYTFTGTVEVRAESKDEAKRIARDDFGMVAGSISTSNESSDENEEGIVDWDISTHPDTTTIK